MEEKDILSVIKAITFKCYYDVKKYCESFDVHHYNGLVGQREKEFFRINPDFLSPYFEELKTNPNSSYITHVKDFIENDYTPSYVSAMIKSINEDHFTQTLHADKELIYSEILGCQILNFYECDTVYNQAIMVEEREEQRYKVLSIDFVSYDEELLTFADLNCDFIGPIVDNVRQIRYELDGSLFDKYSEEEKEKVLNDYAYSYLIRRHILKDTDFFHTNSGILVGETLRHINFDYEYCLSSDEVRGTSLKENLSYCRNRFKDAYYKFIEKTRILYEVLNNIRTSQIVITERHDQCLNVLEDSLSRAMVVINKLEKSNINR